MERTNGGQTAQENERLQDLEATLAQGELHGATAFLARIDGSLAFIRQMAHQQGEIGRRNEKMLSDLASELNDRAQHGIQDFLALNMQDFAEMKRSLIGGK